MIVLTEQLDEKDLTRVRRSRKASRWGARAASLLCLMCTGELVLARLHSSSDIANVSHSRMSQSKEDVAKLAMTSESNLRALLSELKSVPMYEELDWRQVPNRVGSVKDQGECAAGWAFASTGLLEGQLVSRGITNKLVPLSEQNLIDCSTNGNCGCVGGDVYIALQDVMDGRGIVSEADYPYVSRQAQCKFNESKRLVSVDSVDMRPLGEGELKNIVSSYGPVAVGMCASEAFRHYTGGIWDHDDFCQQTFAPINHFVLIIGFGTDPKAGDFWLVKNSWGAKWGERGFFRIKRGSNFCKIATIAYTAVPIGIRSNKLSARA